MEITPISNISFGIYKGSKVTGYGKCDYGVYKGNNIEIYHDTKDNTKLIYISDQLRNWIKSKLEYFDKGKSYHDPKVFRMEAAFKKAKE